MKINFEALLKDYETQFNINNINIHQFLASDRLMEDNEPRIVKMLRLKVDDLGYYDASLICMQLFNLSDHLFLLMVPRLIRILVSNDGHLKAIEIRLNKIEKGLLSDEQLTITKKLTDNLRNIELVSNNSFSDNIIQMI